MIDLTDVAANDNQEKTETDAEETLNEPLINLTDVVTATDEPEATAAEDVDVPADADDEGMIDLTDLAANDHQDEAPADETPAVEEAPEEPIIALADVLPPTDGPEAADDTVPLTEAQVAAALERVIEKRYGERIEQFLVQTIEKTVRQEIEKIKRTLLEDDDVLPH